MEKTKFITDMIKDWRTSAKQCRSVDREAEADIYDVIERDEKAITMGLHLLPHWYPNCPPDHLAEHEGVADEMDTLHLRKIDLADEIFVVNFQDYIGDSTRKEIEYAISKGIKVRWFRQDEIGQKVINLMP